MSINKARTNVKRALTLSIIKSLVIGVVVTIATTVICFYLSPTSLFLPLLLQGDYLAAFIRMSLYVLGITLLDITRKWSDIKEAFELLNKTK